MAIDANVLINERVREELRGGASPQAAINTGYERAFATILDSNVTTLIAGLALLAFGSGPVRGFAVVHCLGILTSMFSAVLFSRGLVNLWYGRQKKLKSVSIGQVWKPGADAPAPELTRANEHVREAAAWNSSASGATSRSCGTRWCSTSSRSLTFLAAVFFLATRGLHLSIEFTGGTVIEVAYAQPADIDKVRAHGREARLRRRAGAELRHLARRADPPAAARRRQAGRRRRRASSRELCTAEGGTVATREGAGRAGRVGVSRQACTRRRRRAGAAVAQRVRRPAGRRGAGRRTAPRRWPSWSSAS